MKLTRWRLTTSAAPCPHRRLASAARRRVGHVAPSRDIKTLAWTGSSSRRFGVVTRPAHALRAGRIVDLRMPRHLSSGNRPVGVAAAARRRSAAINGARRTQGSRNTSEQIICNGLPAALGRPDAACRALLTPTWTASLTEDFQAGLPGCAPGCPGAGWRLRRRDRATATFETIRDAATAGQSSKPAHPPTTPLPGTPWNNLGPPCAQVGPPTRSYINRLTNAPKHHRRPGPDCRDPWT